MVFVFCLLGLFGAVSSPPDQVRDLVRLLEARYRSAKTLEAVFLEKYFENGREVRVESGKAYFRRPGKMRWEYESPEVKLFVSDGKKVWFYVPADRTVMRSAVKESADWRTPFLLLVRNPKISDLCKSLSVGAATEAEGTGKAVLHCEPKGAEAGSRDEIVLEINPATGDLSRVLIREAGDVQIEFRFGEWVRNLEIPAGQFEFHAPPGVAIVEAEPTQ